MFNLIEKAGRGSKKEFSHFLNIAGSLFELETQLIIARNVEYFKNDKLEELINCKNDLWFEKVVKLNLNTLY